MSIADIDVNAIIQENRELKEKLANATGAYPSNRSFQVNFKRFKDQAPEEGDEIFYINYSKFNGAYEFRFGEVDVQYEEYDEDGDPTGNSYFLDMEDGVTEADIPPNCKKIYCIDGFKFDEDTLWVSAADIDELLDLADSEIE